MNPFVFIVGCARSGTTLLKRMVDAHSQIAITPETHWITRYFDKRTGLTPEGLVTPELIPRLFEYHRFPRLEVGREQLERLMDSDVPVSYSSFVTGIFDSYGKRKGKTLVGDKTPEYVWSIPTLHSLWPRAKFVHIIRDGRDVCLSVINWRKFRLHRRFSAWNVDPVATTAVWWDRVVRLGREAGNSLATGQYHEVRYESLVSQPANECAKLCEFLGVSYDEAMLRFHEGREKTDPGLDAKKAWRPVTPGLRDWRSQMPAEDIERFEAAAGELLVELGYERAFPNPSPQALKEVSMIRDSFTRDARALGQRLPEGW
jgi:hypothetical protein